ncbi:anticodon-binding aminoacyl-tRNA synthetase, class 1a [Tanacetum coccineum]
MEKSIQFVEWMMMEENPLWCATKSVDEIVKEIGHLMRCNSKARGSGVRSCINRTSFACRSCYSNSRSVQKLGIDLKLLQHSLERGKADRIVHVADVGQRDKIEMCITAAESVGWNVTNHCHDPLSHVGFVQVEGFEGFGLVQLLDEAKSRCKAILVGKDGGLKHTAKALGYGAVKYEVLKNNRLTDYTFRFDDMFKETVFLSCSFVASDVMHLYILFSP